MDYCHNESWGVSVKIADLYGSSETDLLYSNGLGAGYPMNKVILALAYLIAAVTNQLFNIVNTACSKIALQLGFNMTNNFWIVCDLVLA